MTVIKNKYYITILKITDINVIKSPSKDTTGMFGKICLDAVPNLVCAWVEEVRDFH